MERKIGETFEFEGKKIKVTAASNGECDGCILDEKCTRSNKAIVGKCEGENRKDGTSVKFVEVQEQQDEQPQEQAEQPQELNLCEILKNCPEGTMFWSPLLDLVTFSRIDNGLIFTKTVDGTEWDFNPDSTITFRFNGSKTMTSQEPMIFPSREQRDWRKVQFETPIEQLPKSWAEFCNTHEVQKGEAYIKDISTIYEAEKSGDTRDTYADMNILPSKQACIQHLALMQLHQLRDCWRDGWKPDWNDGDQNKYVIVPNEGEFKIYEYHTISRFIAFQDEKRADEFKDYFIDLIRKAGDLI